jgi:Ni/Fe-hydrogenase subunit HybB-like protein
MFFIIALGTLLPMMHQSSLGTLLVVLGCRSIRCGKRRSSRCSTC